MLKRKLRNLLFFLFFCVILFFLAGLVIKQRYADIDPLHLLPVNMIKGTVVSNNHGCAVDGGCFLTIKTPDRVRKVVYHHGWEGCLNDKVSSYAYDIKEGETVEVRGELIDGEYFDICPSKDYYIKIIK